MKKDADGVVAEIAERLTDVNLVSFSGGKDSTTVLQLVLAAIAVTDKRLIIVTADTRMEIPYFQSYVEAVKTRLRDYIVRERLNAEVVTVMPEPKDSFWSAVLGKGYPAAHMGFRWCTGKLKIDPITRYTKTVTSGHAYRSKIRRNGSVGTGALATKYALKQRGYFQSP